MPLRNRVTPFGELVAIPERGTFTGNRGILHDPATRTIERLWSNPAWIVCRLEFRGNRRIPMSRRSWTELFFLDEAVAFAAGHRPCYYCRRDAARAFAAAWATACGGPVPKAPQMDARLHAERLDGRKQRLHPLRGTLQELPDGAMVAVSGEAYVVHSGRAHRYTPGGYHAACELSRVDGVLTPPSTLAALSAGYRCVLHESLRAP